MKRLRDKNQIPVLSSSFVTQFLISKSHKENQRSNQIGFLFTYFTEKGGVVIRVELSEKLQVGPHRLHLGAALSSVLPSGTARALVRGPFADTALGTLGAAHGAAGAAAWKQRRGRGQSWCPGSSCHTGPAEDLLLVQQDGGGVVLGAVGHSAWRKS